MKKRIAILPVVVILLLVGVGCTSPTTTVKETDAGVFEGEFTFTPSIVVPGQRDFSCTSVVSASLASLGAEGPVKAGLSGKPSKLSISFGEETMKLITAAAIDIGETEAAEFSIAQDDAEHLVAVAKLNYGRGPNWSLFVFDKVSQQAIWSKASNAFMKFGEVMYLNCQ